jgi:hypothetical protein
MALIMWEGVTDKKWSFLSPPGLLRDKGMQLAKYYPSSITNLAIINLSVQDFEPASISYI